MIGTSPILKVTEPTLYLRKDIGRRGRQNSIALPLFDFFNAHHDKRFIKMIPKNKIRTIFVSPFTTEELQPWDRSVNGKLKFILKHKL